MEKLKMNANENLPRILGQRKVHKDDNPMRLIICSRETILSYLSQEIYKMIKQLRETIDNSITNTNQLVATISNIKTETNERLASLDIQGQSTWSKIESDSQKPS